MGFPFTRNFQHQHVWNTATHCWLLYVFVTIPRRMIYPPTLGKSIWWNPHYIYYIHTKRVHSFIACLPFNVCAVRVFACARMRAQTTSHQNGKMHKEMFGSLFSDTNTEYIFWYYSWMYAMILNLENCIYRCTSENHYFYYRKRIARRLQNCYQIVFKYTLFYVHRRHCALN